MNFIIVLIVSYLLGAIPFAYIMTRLITGKDVRSYGSGNVGATNAARILGFKYGLLIAILDILKGILAVSIAKTLIQAGDPRYFLLIASLLVIIGHNWSIFLKFSGGKGVATTFGIILSLYPIAFLVFSLSWISIVLLTRYVSLASIISAILVPIIVYITTANIYDLLFTLLFAILIVLRHSGNIKRLVKGNESKMSWPLGVKKGDI